MTADSVLAWVGAFALLVAMISFAVAMVVGVVAMIAMLLEDFFQ